MVLALSEPLSGSLGKDANIVATSSKRGDSVRAFRMLNHAQKLLIDSDVKSKSGNVHRTRFCHLVRSHQAETITLKISSDAASETANLSGVQTCGSVWSCPVCAKRIAVQRGKEIGHAIDFMIKSGHVPIMITNTARHDASMRLKPFKEKFKASHRSFVQHRRWRELKEVFGLQHSIKAVEATWSLENGWHYHQHSILFIHADKLKNITDEGWKHWEKMARNLWMDSMEKHGLTGVPSIAFHVQASGDIKRDYLAKLGMEDETSNLDYELSAGHNKNRGGLKIWNILERAWQGSEKHAEIYIEYVEAMTGDNWITWSHGLKELCDIENMEDESAAAIEKETFEQIELLQMDDETFLPVRKLHALPDLIELAARTRNKEAVQDFLRTLAIRWNNSGAGAERDRLASQYKAMTAKRDNWQKSIIKSQNFEGMPAYQELCREIENIGKMLKF